MFIFVFFMTDCHVWALVFAIIGMALLVMSPKWLCAFLYVAAYGAWEW